MAVLIVNQYSDNYGDHLNGLAAIELARSIDDGRVSILYIGQRWETEVPDVDCEHLRALKPWQNVRLDFLLHLFRLPHKCSNDDNWKTIARLVGRASAVVSAPSGEAIGKYRSYSFLAPLLVARRARKPRHIFLGTFHRCSTGWNVPDRVFDLIARYCTAGTNISVRTLQSAQYLTQLKRDYCVGDDAAFLPIKTVRDRFRSASSPSSPVLSVVLGPPMNWHPDSLLHTSSGLHRAVLGCALEAAKALGLACELVPHSPLDQELAFFEALADAYPGDVSICHQVGSCDDYVRVLGRSQVIVSLRYHGCIVGVASAVPTVGVAYEAKITELAERNYRNLRMVPHTDLSRLRDEIIAAAGETLTSKDEVPSASVAAAIAWHTARPTPTFWTRRYQSAPRR